MSEQKAQERILCSLFGASKTTKTLAAELGYTDKEGRGNCKIIGRDLKKLKDKGCIISKNVKLNKFGVPPTLYSISDIQNLRAIYKNYPNLIPEMQNSLFVQENILESNVDDSISKEIKEYLRKMLQSCPSFFRYMLFDNDIELLEYIGKFAEISKGEIHYELLLTTEEIYKVVMGINVVFRAFVNKELADGHSSTEAVEYVRKIYNKPSKAVIRIVLEHNSKNKDAPDLRGKRVITLITPELQEVFQQNLKNLVASRIKT